MLDWSSNLSQRKLNTDYKIFPMNQLKTRSHQQLRLKYLNRKKTRDASQNTIVTFSPDCDVEMKEIVLSESDIDEGSNQKRYQNVQVHFDYFLRQYLIRSEQFLSFQRHNLGRM